MRDVADVDRLLRTGADKVGINTGAIALNGYDGFLYSIGFLVAWLVALLLVAAVVLALVWSNSPWGASYDAFWRATVGLTAGPWTLTGDLRTWIDEGLMTLFFLVVGLEIKREFLDGSSPPGLGASCPGSRSTRWWRPPRACAPAARTTDR